VSSSNNDVKKKTTKNESNLKGKVLSNNDLIDVIKNQLFEITNTVECRVSVYIQIIQDRISEAEFIHGSILTLTTSSDFMTYDKV